VKKDRLLLYIVFLLLAIAATYSNHFQNDFHFDDFHSIVQNPYIRSIKNVPLFFKDGATSSVLPQNQAYRPVVTTSLALDYLMGNGYSLFYFHLSTFILFLAQGLLMLFFFRKILNLASANKYVDYVAFFATAWYMLHPAVAETVNYIIARSDVQSTVAVLGAFALYIYSPFCRKTFIYLLPVGIGALAKPPSIMFAPLLFLYILFFEDKIGLADLFKKAHLPQLWNTIKKSVPAFVFCAFFYWLVTRLTPKTWEPGGHQPLLYLITQPYVILHYFATFFWPTGLSADTDWGLLENIRDVRFFAGCAFILVMLGLAFYTSRKEILRPVSFGILWFFLTLLPTSSIIPLGEVLNDHRMFFPFVGLALAVSWSIGLILFKLAGARQTIPVVYKRTTLLAALIILSACAYGTWKRNDVWRSEENLWKNVTIKSPKNSRGMMNYGLIKLNEGNLPEAEMYFNKAMALSPTYSFIYANMGALKEKAGDYAAAENYYLTSLHLGSAYASHYFLYGRFLYRQNRLIEAEVMFQKAVGLSNSYMDPRILLMKTYAILGEWEQLKEVALTTLNISPGNDAALLALKQANKRKTGSEIDADAAKASPTAEKYLTLSLDYFKEGKYQLCIDAAKEALKLKPTFAEAYNNIGCAFNAMNEFDKAAPTFKMALDLKPNYSLAKNNAQMSAGHRHISDDIISSRVYTPEEFLTQSLTYYNRGQYELCIAACVSALLIKPDYDLAYNNLCAAYVKLKQWDDAIMLAEKGLKISPNNVLLKNNLAEAVKGKKNGK
jgi:tetratricopeptide (TPR) repeat protein